MGVRTMRLDSFQWCPTTGQGATGTSWNRKFHLNMRINFFTVRVTGQWNRLPRLVVESPSLETFKIRLNAFLCPLLWVSLLKQGGWTRWSPEVPSNPTIL